MGTNRGRTSKGKEYMVRKREKGNSDRIVHKIRNKTRNVKAMKKGRKKTNKRR